MLRRTPTGLRRAPRRQKLLIDSTNYGTAAVNKKNGKNIHGNTARTQNSWPIRGRGHIKRVAQARAQIALAGMEEEAERLLKKLKHEQTPPEDSVVATPTETD
jgi:hypothetical protein